MAIITAKHLISSQEQIDAIRSFFGNNALNIYISQGGDPFPGWDDINQKKINSLTVKPADWQAESMERTIENISKRFNVSLNIVQDLTESDIPILITNIPHNDSISGTFDPDDYWASDEYQVFLSMSYQTGLWNDSPYINERDTSLVKHDTEEKLTWSKTFLHEMGHLLGLEHPFDREDGDWAVDENDETPTTPMGWQSSTNAEGKYFSFFQEVDMEALDEIWGEGPGYIERPVKFRKKFAKKINGKKMDDESKAFNVNIASFGLDKDPIIHFASGKKETMKIHARHDNDFIYDTKKDRLYFNENGAVKGLGEGGLVAIIKGVDDIDESNFDFFDLNLVHSDFG